LRRPGIKNGFLHDRLRFMIIENRTLISMHNAQFTDDYS
jgi:hypothetical protein